MMLAVMRKGDSTVAGVVTEGVEDAVRGDEARGLADEGGAALGGGLLQSATMRELGIEAGDGFELVERAAGVTEGASGDHGDADAGDALAGWGGRGRRRRGWGR